MKTLTAIVCAAALAFGAGCEEDKPKGPENPQPITIAQLNDSYRNHMVTVRGRLEAPAAYSKWGNTGVTSIAFTVRGKERTLLVRASDFSDRGGNAESLAALIQSELRDGDDDEIEIRGKYGHDGTYLVPYSVRVQGYTLTLMAEQQ